MTVFTLALLALKAVEKVLKVQKSANYWDTLRGITVQHLRRSRVVNAAKRQPFPTSKSHGVVSEKPLGLHFEKSMKCIIFSNVISTRQNQSKALLLYPILVINGSVEEGKVSSYNSTL